MPVSAIGSTIGAPFGATGGAALTVDERKCHIDSSELRRIHEEWLPAYMAGEAGHER